MAASLIAVRRSSFVIITAVLAIVCLQEARNAQAFDSGDYSPTSVNLSTVATSTTLSASPNPSIFGQSVTFTATVTSTSGITPTGIVTFTDGAATLDIGTLLNGQISINTSALSTGPHVITATYSGDDNHAGSISPSLITVVNHRPSVDAGRNHTCAVKANGILACWGSDGFGGTAAPPPTPGNPFVQVSAGGGHTCAVKADGTLVCWGNNEDGQAPIIYVFWKWDLPDAVVGVPYSRTLGAFGSSA